MTKRLRNALIIVISFPYALAIYLYAIDTWESDFMKFIYILITGIVCIAVLIILFQLVQITCEQDQKDNTFWLRISIAAGFLFFLYWPCAARLSFIGRFFLIDESVYKAAIYRFRQVQGLKEITISQDQITSLNSTTLLRSTEITMSPSAQIKKEHLDSIQLTNLTTYMQRKSIEYIVWTSDSSIILRRDANLIRYSQKHPLKDPRDCHHLYGAWYRYYSW